MSTVAEGVVEVSQPSAAAWALVQSRVTEALRAPAYRAVAWQALPGLAGVVRLLDQKRLPLNETYVECRDVETLSRCIEDLTVRGAPAIGIAAAYGVALSAACHRGSVEDYFDNVFARDVARLRRTRPTAVNLFWAIARMEKRGLTLREIPEMAAVRALLLDEARRIDAEDEAMCRAMGRHGAALMPDGGGVLTHCNAGGLATSAFGTAVSVILHGLAAGKRYTVYADETRPLLQGARLTTWELLRAGVTPVLLCDSMAASLMAKGRIQAVVVGADRICANGDTANKIGTFGLAIVAKHHGVPVYVAAPSSTIDAKLASGVEIPIEQRSPAEVTTLYGIPTAPEGVRVYNLAFDVTPAELITAIVTERGVFHAPYSFAAPQVSNPGVSNPANSTPGVSHP